MFDRPTRVKVVLSVLFVVGAGACGAGGGCGACSAVQPLPGGKLPVRQTVEGGAQIRVTPHGFGTLTSILPGLINQQISGGFCLPSGTLLGFVSYCEGNNGGCVNGCRIFPTLNSVTVSTTNPQALGVHVDARARVAVPVSAGIDCTLNVTVDHLVGDLSVGLGVDATTGELTVQANPITTFNISDPNVGGCGFASNIVQALAGLFHDSLVGFILDRLSPAVVSLVDGFVPNPLGLAGVLDLGNLLDGLLPGVAARMETRIVPGGYAHMNAGGLSLGVITGINADRDPATRTPGLDSEPSPCVPPLSAPNLAGPPMSLPATQRSSFRLDVAGAFDGAADPATDLAMGISKTTLDLAGHHLITSGALCLGVGTSLVKQLTVGTISILVPSLAALQSDQGNDPLLLVTRPQRALSFSIGDNTVASPAVTVHLEHLEIDFYGFLFERYVRVFTLDLTVNAGVNLEIAQAAGQPATVKPILVGVSPDTVKVTALNTEFIRETPEHLEAVLPTVLTLVIPALANLPELTVPSFAGFTLDHPTIHRVTTSQDDFLAINASLKPSPQMLALAATEPLMANAVAEIEAGLARRAATGGRLVGAGSAAPSTGRARLIGVTTPAPAQIRGALLHEVGGALPRVTFDADASDSSGRPLEWSYQLDNGMWRPWRTGAPLVIEDAAFAWQGKYTVGLRSRVVGDMETVSEPIEIAVIIDSVAPRIAVDKARWNDDTFEIPAFDGVSGSALQYGFGRADSSAPQSPWTDGGTVELARDTAAAYAGPDGKLAVFVKDEAGNIAMALVAPLPAASGGCAAGTHSGPGAVVLIAVGWLVVRRRRAARGAALAALIGCGGSTSATTQPPPTMTATCETAADCGACPGQLPFCIDATCVCSSDIPLGQVGPYSHVAVGPDGAIWVSAYAQSHGDLVVAQATAGRIPAEAWEWVDGVPAGPVMVPGSKIRGGVAADGADVGMYTSIAVAPDGTPMVSYFDRDTASLKLAQKINGAWQIHIVDRGTGALGDSGALVGMYTALTLRSDDGRPGIAYLAHVETAAGSRAEVRFASAQTAHPAVAGDWLTWVVDTAALPPDDPANPAGYPLPEGLGLFVAAARMPNQAPVVAYYDRSNGDLKVARFNVTTGQFAAARVLDGAAGVDVGWSPSVAVDTSGVVRVAYVSATAHDLKYVTDAANSAPQVIDDGYRIDGQTVDGLPKPTFHFVGSDAGIALPPGGRPMVVYQDATTQELLLARQGADGSWTHTSIAGATDPWPGGYGFFASAALAKTQLVISSWVVNPSGDAASSNWVEVFSRPLGM